MYFFQIDDDTLKTDKYVAKVATQLLVWHPWNTRTAPEGLGDMVELHKSIDIFYAILDPRTNIPALSKAQISFMQGPALPVVFASTRRPIQGFDYTNPRAQVMSSSYLRLGANMVDVLFTDSTENKWVLDAWLTKRGLADQVAVLAKFELTLRGNDMD
jgi:hypothetical protein